MRTVNEVSKLTGISVRTLHHYDAIGLLKPSDMTEAGYRLYDDAALRRLQSILLFRELRFPLKEIKAILDSPSFDPREALEQQIELLELERKRLGEIIALARDIAQQGAEVMNFQAFDKSELERYKEEAKARWDATEAYQAYERNEKSGRDMNQSGRELMERFAGLGKLRHLSLTAPEVQQAIADLRAFITERFYPCTPEILKGLGQMYVSDERFRQTIDQAGGEGTAAFVQQAIGLFCN